MLAVDRRSTGKDPILNEIDRCGLHASKLLPQFGYYWQVADFVTLSVIGVGNITFNHLMIVCGKFVYHFLVFHHIWFRGHDQS